jgi:hypothetical protein
MAPIPPIVFRPDWKGLTAVVIGNGNSILSRDFTPILAREDWRTLVANGGYHTVPGADVLMCSDRHWLKDNPDLRGFRGSMIVVTRPEVVTRADPRMVHVRREFIERVKGDIFEDAGRLVEGHNSTSTNISQAVLRGARRILLLGIDLTAGESGRRSAYNAAPDDPLRARTRYQRQVQHLTMQAAHLARRGVEVFNCSPRSALECYPYATIEEFTG